MITGGTNGRASLPDSRVLLAFVLSTVLAGGNAVAVRFTVAEIQPFWGATMRFVAASLILWAMILMRKRRLPVRGEIAPYVLYGAIGFGAAYALLYWGLQTVPAGVAQVILALTPLLTLLLAVLDGREAFRWRGLAGALIAVSGIGLSFLQSEEAGLSLLPMLAVAGGALCFAASSVVLKRVNSPDPFTANAVGMSTGAIMLLLFSLLAGETWSLPAKISTWLSVLHLVIVGSVIVFTLSVYVLGKWTASASSYQLVLMPFVTVTLGALLAGESVGGGLLVGGALVLIGVWVGALSGTARTPIREPVIAAAGEAD